MLWLVRLVLGWFSGTICNPVPLSNTCPGFSPSCVRTWNRTSSYLPASKCTGIRTTGLCVLSKMFFFFFFKVKPTVTKPNCFVTWKPFWQESLPFPGLGKRPSCFPQQKHWLEVRRTKAGLVPESAATQWQWDTRPLCFSLPPWKRWACKVLSGCHPDYTHHGAQHPRRHQAAWVENGATQTTSWLYPQTAPRRAGPTATWVCSTSGGNVQNICKDTASGFHSECLNSEVQNLQKPKPTSNCWIVGIDVRTMKRRRVWKGD